MVVTLRIVFFCAVGRGTRQVSNLCFHVLLATLFVSFSHDDDMTRIQLHQ